jgi:hypothetical protein
MSIFGDETITLPGSPDAGQDEGGAVSAGNENDAAEGFEEREDAEFEEADEGGEQQDDEQADDDEGDASPGDDAGQGDNGLILGKFKTQEDLAKAYLNLQREFTKQRQARSQQQPAAAPAQTGQGQSVDLNEVFWAQFRQNPAATIQAIVQHAVSQHTAPLVEERRTEVLGRQFEELAKEYRQLATDEGMQKFTAAIQDVAAELGNPDLAFNPTPRMLRMAAQEAFGDTAAKAYERGKQAGRQDSERARQSKQGVAVPVGGAKRKAETLKTPADEIKAAILEAGRSGGGIFG